MLSTNIWKVDTKPEVCNFYILKVEYVFETSTG